MRLDVNLNGVTTKEALHDRIRQMLPVPGYEGTNLDALADTLTSIRGDTEIIFHNMNPVCDAMPQYAERLLRMFILLEEQCPNLRFLFYP